MTTPETKFGKLTFIPALTEPTLMADPVKTAVENLPVADAVLISPIDPSLSDTAAFCEAYEIGMDEGANCVIVEGRRGERTTLAAVLVRGTDRADINKVVKKFLDVRKVSFADREKAVAESGMEFGAITPIGLPADWPILIDAAVAASAKLIIGSGVRASKLLVSGATLAALPNATVIEGLAQ